MRRMCVCAIGRRIWSLQNARIKNLVKLGKRRTHDEQRLTLVEGTREIGHTFLTAGITPVECTIVSKKSRLILRAVHWPCTVNNWLGRARQTLYAVTPAVYRQIAAYREESGGLLLVTPILRSHWPPSHLHTAPFFLAVIEGVEKPGSLGAILRTADAAGVDGVIVCAGRNNIPIIPMWSAPV